MVAVLEGAGEGGVGGEVFVEDGGDDLGDGFVLEDAAVATVGQGGERRFDGEAVAGEAAVGAGKGGAGDQAGEQAGAPIRQQEFDLGGLAEQAFEFAVGVDREAVELVAVGTGEGFFADQAVWQKVVSPQARALAKTQAQ